MTRVWLSDWEWECCGEPFGVGDEVDFGIQSRDAAGLREHIGDAIARTVDASESHHEEEWPDRVRGRVEAAYAVAVDTVERRIDREPPPERPRFILSGTGTGVWAAAPRLPFTVEVTQVPESAELFPVDTVGAATEERDASLLSKPDPVELDPPRERHVRRHVGWIVDVTP